jgi:VWFA-related protein
MSIVKRLRPQDKVMIVEFDDDMEILSELTDDREKISKAVRKLNFGDGTSIYDAVQSLFKKQISLIEGRKAIILLTDGVDTTSDKAGYESSLEEAEKYDVPVFPVYLDTFQNVISPKVRNSGFSGRLLPQVAFREQSVEEMKEMYELGKMYLNDLVSISGGRQIPFESLSDKNQKFLENAAEELRLKYYVSFKPSETQQTARRRQIKVRVNRPDLLVLARGSYLISEK